MARKRAQQEVLRQQLASAQQQGTSALRLADAEQTEQRDRDLKADATKYAREQDALRLAMEQKQSDRAEAALRLEQEREQRAAERDQSERSRQADLDRQAEEKRGEEERKARVRMRVQALGGDLDADQLEQIATEEGSSPDEVRALSQDVSYELRKRKLDIEGREAETKTKQRKATTPVGGATSPKAKAPPAIPATIAQQWGAAEYSAVAAESLASEVEPDDFTAGRRAVSAIPGGTTLMGAIDDRSAKINRSIDRFIQNAGKGLEGGKMTDADALRYRRSLLSASDSYETFVREARAIAAEIRAKVAAEKRALTGAGYASGAGPVSSAPTQGEPAGRDVSPDDFFEGR